MQFFFLDLSFLLIFNASVQSSSARGTCLKNHTSFWRLGVFSRETDLSFEAHLEFQF